MKRTFILCTLALAFTLLAAGCSKKDAKPDKPKSYATYSDGVLKFGIKYPDGWAQAVTLGTTAQFYTAKELSDAFYNYEPGDLRGAKIEVGAFKGGDKEMNDHIDKLKSIITDPTTIKGPEQSALNGIPATKLVVNFPVGETKYFAERYYVIKDGVVTYLETAVFGEYNDYKGIFDAATAGFTPGAAGLPRAAGSATAADTVAKEVNEPPAETTKQYNGSGFSLNYPSNYTPTTEAKNVQFSGARRDCIIRVDILDPKGLTLDQIAPQNAKSYKTAPVKTSLAGKPAYLFNTGSASVDTRAYFVMGSGKLYRLTLTWFKPQAAQYRSAYDKVLASVKIQ